MHLTQKHLRVFCFGLIALGVLLRFIDVSYPDLYTDEAQYALNATAAHPPLLLWLIQLSQMVGGANLFAVRVPSVLLGCASLWLIYQITRDVFGEQEALLATTVAAIFPSHILFSRLMFLSVPQLAAWLAATLCFLRARKSSDGIWLLLLFVASLASTMVKAQGILLPGLLLLGRIIELRGRFLKDAIAWVLALSFLPFVAYVATHPGIAATLFLYGGNRFGGSDLIPRIVGLLVQWWETLSLFCLAILLSIPWIKKCTWPLWMLLCIALTIGILLAPSPYYQTHLMAFAIPIGAMLATQKRMGQLLMLSILGAWSVASLGPISWNSPQLQSTLLAEPYWNTHAAQINEAIADASSVIAIGDAGHHLRWYIDTPVLVGKDMTLPDQGLFLVLDETEIQGEIVYQDHRTKLVRR